MNKDQKIFNATAEGQRKMFYEAGKTVLRAKLSDFINDRHKQRFKMVEDWRSNGKSDEEWKKIELFDEDTERQVEILSRL